MPGLAKGTPTNLHEHVMCYPEDPMVPRDPNHNKACHILYTGGEYCFTSSDCIASYAGIDWAAASRFSSVEMGYNLENWGRNV